MKYSYETLITYIVVNGIYVLVYIKSYKIPNSNYTLCGSFTKYCSEHII